MSVDLDLVPLREPSMEPHEVLSSESQERMLVVVKPQDLDEVLAICRRWGVLATRIGEVTDDRPARSPLARRGLSWTYRPPRSPTRDRSTSVRSLVPADLDALQADEPGWAAPADRPARRTAATARLTVAVLAGLGHRPVRPLRARQHRPGAAGGRRRPASVGGHRRSVSPSRPTATAVTADSTRTPERSWCSPRRAATSPRPAPNRSP